MNINLTKFKEVSGFLSFMMLSLYSAMGLLSVLWFYTAFSWVNYLILLASIVIVLAFVFFPSYFFKMVHDVNFIYFLSICFFVFLSLALQMAFASDAIDNQGRSAFGFVVATFFFGLLWFLAGASFQFFDLKASNFFAIAILAFLLVLISQNLVDGFVIAYWNINMIMGTDSVTHLSVGDYFLFFVVLALSLATGMMRLLLFPVALLVLFAVGSRTIFYLFVPVWLCHYLFFVDFKRGTIYVASLALLLFGFVLPYMALVDMDQLLARMLFSGGVEVDDSFEQRIQLFLEALMMLGEQLFYGGLALTVNQFGTIGAYMHNIMSAWQFYGLIPFLLILFLFFRLFVYIWGQRAVMNERMDYFGSLLFVYVFFAAIFSRSVAYNLMWFVFGFWIMRIYSSKSGATRR